MLKKYLLETSGNVAMMFAGMCTMLIVGVGAAVDYTGASQQHNDLQHYVDAAVLAAAKTRSTDITELEEVVAATMAFHNKQGLPIITKTEIKNDQIRVTADLKYKTSIMGFVGQDYMDLKAGSASPLAKLTPINLALVVDTTGSMAGANMQALITATEDLITELKTVDSKVNVSLVPFGQYVNVGLNNENANWIDTSLNGTTETYQHCWMAKETVTAPVCTPTGRTITQPIYEDGVQTGTRSYDEKTCTAGEYRDLGEQCEMRTRTYAWHGCVNSRPDPDNMYPQYDSKVIPAHYNDPDKCGAPIVPMTDKLDDIETAVSNLTARGETYLPSGLIWGWRTLDQRQPFTEVGNPKAGTVNAILFMTDGGNTKNLMSDGTHSGSNGATGLLKTRGLCDQVKASDVQIFTVGYRLPGSATATAEVLDYCASSPDSNFNPDNSRELSASFKQIGKMLDRTRLAY